MTWKGEIAKARRMLTRDLDKLQDQLQSALTAAVKCQEEVKKLPDSVTKVLKAELVILERRACAMQKVLDSDEASFQVCLLHHACGITTPLFPKGGPTKLCHLPTCRACMTQIVDQDVRVTAHLQDESQKWRCAKASILTCLTQGEHFAGQIPDICAFLWIA